MVIAETDSRVEIGEEEREQREGGKDRAGGCRSG
jgi:hypothetical protein